MKGIKYKLIKEYPTSPKLGTIITLGSDGYLSYTMNDYFRRMGFIHKNELPKYSEFWEKID